MAENNDIKLTLEAWADIVIKKWEQKMIRLRIGHTHKLIRSFTQTVITEANGDPDRIQFAFEYYGRFVDMGVGNGVPIDKVEFTKRKAKQWYSKIFFSQIERLKEIIVQKYSQRAKISILQEIDNSGIRLII